VDAGTSTGRPTPITAFFAAATQDRRHRHVRGHPLSGPFGHRAQWQQIVVFVAIASMAALGAFAAESASARSSAMMAYSFDGHMGLRGRMGRRDLHGGEGRVWYIWRSSDHTLAIRGHSGDCVAFWMPDGIEEIGDLSAWPTPIPPWRSSWPCCCSVRDPPPRPAFAKFYVSGSHQGRPLHARRS